MTHSEQPRKFRHKARRPLTVLGLTALAPLGVVATAPAAHANFTLPSTPPCATCSPVSRLNNSDLDISLPDQDALAIINGARQHPELYPPHGDTAGATMTGCSNALTYSTALHDTAMAHSDYLASQPVDWVNTYPNMHKDPNGKMAWDAGEPMDQAGYHSVRAEIVADGFPTTDAALQFWMQDDAGSNWGHRNLILDCTIQDAGPAILVDGPAGSYYTVDMGTP